MIFYLFGPLNICQPLAYCLDQWHVDVSNKIFSVNSMIVLHDLLIRHNFFSFLGLYQIRGRPLFVVNFLTCRARRFSFSLFPLSNINIEVIWALQILSTLANFGLI